MLQRVFSDSSVRIGYCLALLAEARARPSLLVLQCLLGTGGKTAVFGAGLLMIWVSGVEEEGGPGLGKGLVLPGAEK